jgi:hypothetical protein
MRYVYAIAKSTGRVHMLHPDMLTKFNEKKLKFNSVEHLLCGSNVEIAELKYIDFDEEHPALCKNCLARLRELITVRSVYHV